MAYEKYLFKVINGDEPCSDASVHAQIKRLRRIFNYAIAEQIITPDVYPFKSYKLPNVTEKYKERLNTDDIKLFEKQKYDRGTGKHNAQNTFMLALRMAGTRIEDMLKLKVKYIIDGRITFNMNKGNTKGKLISIEISPKIQEILNQYVTKDSKPDDYILPYLSSEFDSLSKTDQKKEVASWTSYINGLLKEIGDDACISTKITTHIARHSFASAVQKVTKDIESVSKALGHSSVKITQRYLEELNVENQDEMMKSLDI
jgi:site-specific recombinase XerD